MYRCNLIMIDLDESEEPGFVVRHLVHGQSETPPLPGKQVIVMTDAGKIIKTGIVERVYSGYGCSKEPEAGYLDDKPTATIFFSTYSSTYIWEMVRGEG